MLIQAFLVLGNRSVIFLPNVVDQDHPIVGAASYQVRILNAEFAGCQLRIAVEDFLRESWVFEGPKHEKPPFASLISFPIVLVGDCQEISVDRVPICAGDRVALKLLGGEGEEIVQGFLVDVLLFFFFLLLSEAQDLILWSLLDKLYFWIVAIGDVFLVENLTVQDSVDIF